LINFFGNNALEGKTIIKVFISGSFFCSGYHLNDIYISDMKTLTLLFDFGKITVNNKEIILKKGDKVTEQELVDFLTQPL